jgi:hypothetical protein
MCVVFQCILLNNYDPCEHVPRQVVRACVDLFAVISVNVWRDILHAMWDESTSSNQRVQFEESTSPDMTRVCMNVGDILYTIPSQSSRHYSGPDISRHRYALRALYPTVEVYPISDTLVLTIDKLKGVLRVQALSPSTAIWTCTIQPCMESVPTEVDIRIE